MNRWVTVEIAPARFAIYAGDRRLGELHGIKSEADAVAEMYDMTYWLAFGDERKERAAVLKNLKARARKIMKVLA